MSILEYSKSIFKFLTESPKNCAKINKKALIHLKYRDISKIVIFAACRNYLWINSIEWILNHSKN